MKILIINQFFWPDAAATGQFLYDLTRHIGTEHEVTVICSGGSYAQTEYAGEEPPVKIIRVPGLPFKRGALARVFSYGAFFLGAMWQEFRLPHQDVVVTMTTPPLLAVAGSILKTFRGTRHYIWEMDMFPDAFVSLGALSPHGWLTRFLGWMEDTARHRSDGIIALGPCMRKRLIARGIPRRLISIAENWADGRAIVARPPRFSGPLNILYSGNLGLSHDVDTILAAMRHFKNDCRFLFTFAGGGVGKAELERRCAMEGIGNASFLAYASRDRIGEHLAEADVGLVTERTACIGTVVPSKVYGIMAAARPLLFIGPQRATPGLLIRRFRCGWQIEPGDDQSLIELLESLSADRDLVSRYGASAREAFERHYDLPHGVARVAEILRLHTPAKDSVETPATAGVIHE